MKNYALLDENNIVINVSVANENWDNSGWIEITRGGIGWFYDGVNFIAPKPYESWKLDSNFDWQAPISMPAQGDWHWDEQAGNWVEA